ncbi:MAG: 6-carboxytetrahydropterin synthase [Fibrobacteres bacterium]|nr:6-carboxytetrahydropterin synthase [Fibrobacterota bacterium]
MQLLSVTKRFNFSASHRLFNRDLSPEENCLLFDACSKQHGHNFNLEVTVMGPVDPVSGMVINFHDLKRIVNDSVVNYLDHSNFETDIPELSNVVHTAENLIQFIWKRIAADIAAPVKLSRLKLYETADNWVEMA